VGRVTFSRAGFAGIIALQNGDQALTLANESQHPPLTPVRGDLIRARGRTAVGGNGKIRLNCTSIDILEQGITLPPEDTALSTLSSGTLDGRYIRVRATLRDVFFDEIDANYLYLVLADEGDSILSSCRRTAENVTRYRSLIGSRIEATGVCFYMSLADRTLCGRILEIDDNRELTVLEKAAADAFDVPGLSDLGKTEPARIARCGRRRVSGTVIAAWGRNKMLVRTNRDELVGVELADDKPAPYGTFVDVVGLPASDLFRINLLRARWREHFGGKAKTEPPVEDITARSLLTDGKGNLQYNSRKHGKVIRLRGTVKALTSGESQDGRFYLESDSFVIPVDASSVPSVFDVLKVGHGIEATGVCIMEGENWSPYSAFPQIRGMMLVVRTPDDIVVVSRPSWWTPGRLLAALGALLAVLGGILFWNLQLRSAVRRREGALKREIFARVNSDMKMRERTNLSIELHDSLSQGLTGVSMEIDTAKRLADDPPEMIRHLGFAARSLKTCRDELRTCIYDLRSNALGDCDMDESIRRTLGPFVSNVELSIRFNVARSLLSDNVTHNLLRIVRELVVNAVNHGHARTVRIAGSIDGAELSFSVRDDGDGFDPANCAGADQGHFGLQGVRERLKRLHGSLVFERNADRGMKAVVTVRLPDEEAEENA